MASSISNGRTKRGTFAQGNKHGRGAVTAATRAERLTALLSVVTAADWAAVCATAVKQARRGDWRARQWLSAHLLPPAAAAVDDIAQPIVIETYDYYAAVAKIATLPTDVTAKLPSIYEPVLS